MADNVASKLHYIVDGENIDKSRWVKESNEWCWG
jgi:hypothetical protein